MTVIKAEVGPAVLSLDRKYRYTLTRVWDVGKPQLAYIGLNPSTADEATLDPTLRRCLDFANSWGYGSFTMLNLFAFRATNPLDMKAAYDPVGPDNDAYILTVATGVQTVVACWGAHGGWLGRDTEVRKMLKDMDIKLHYLKLTKDGRPNHPLFLPKTLTPQEWT